MKAEKLMAWAVASATCIALAAPVAHADDNNDFDNPIDFGAKMERMLADNSDALFGVQQPLAAPATAADYVARDQATANQRVKLADGLSAHYVTRNMAQWGDMMDFWPNKTNYSHLIVCIEQSRVADGSNPSVQRVNVNTGEVETILYGMNRCDGVTTTAWGTVLVSEETGDGRAYEIIDPLTTSGQWIANRTSGDIRTAVNAAATSTKVVQRDAMPTAAWEGLAVLPSGVTYSGDELRPGTGLLDSDGGSLFKFVPKTPRTGTGTGQIADLADSPLVDGTTYAMTVSCREETSSSFPQYGQGCEIGAAAWVKIDPLFARAEADFKGATGYYRPEDLHLDPNYQGPGARFCVANTGREKAQNYGEVVCVNDTTPEGDGSNIVDTRSLFLYQGFAGDYAVAHANRFVEGDARLNSVDNLGVDAVRNNLAIIEDHKYGEVFSCLSDGADRDIKSDGCIALLSVVDPAAEPTGFMFDASGQVAFINLQHGEQPASLLDFNSNPVNGQTDDLLMITGFELDD
ncbi:MAG: alkaline phosphatase PhoX [Leptospirillia bacterium]